MTRRSLSSTPIVAIIVLSATSALAAKNPSEFITDAIKGDNSEIMLGHMAEEKGGSQQVKDFGKTLVADHSTAKQEASTVAKALGVTPPDTPMAEAKDEQKKLSTMSGDGFDQEFASYMVTDHKKDIQAFQEQVKGNDGQTSALASKQLPVLQKHLEMAQTIAEGASQSGTAAGGLSNTLTQESPDQWRASKLAGVAVYGPEKKDIGKITDVLLSKDGQAEYVIIGVGGFLGIGEKDVAVPFNQVKFTDQPMTPSMNAAAPNNAMGGAGASGATTAAPGSNAPNGTPPRVAANDPAMPAASSTGGSTGEVAMPRSTVYPDHGMIDMTADQLKSAPTFHFAR
jgi:putative membrane protein